MVATPAAPRSMTALASQSWEASFARCTDSAAIAANSVFFIFASAMGVFR